ncbi:MAG: hypothetical protein Q4D79_08240 [Propionibacteriaceae bacterium]|nr:hypothetical protein [Propionibacteriaceae bacterium]
MRRRAFLTAAGVLPILGACSSSPATVPTPSVAPMQAASRMPLASPPDTSAVPTVFASTPRWSHPSGGAVITAARTHYMCGSLLLRESGEVANDGWRPIVVDLQEPTTWAVLPEEDGKWSTSAVVSDNQFTVPPPPHLQNTGAWLTTGPALLSDDYAYLLVATSIPNAQTELATSFVVDLVKVSLVDGTVAAIARVSDAYATALAGAQLLTNTMSICFSEDRSALLVAGKGDMDLADSVGFEVRLSASDTIDEADHGSFADIVTPAINTEQRELILLKSQPDEGSVFSVRRPGDAEPLLSWDAAEAALPSRVCVFGDIAYLAPPRGEETVQQGALRLISLSSGQFVGEVLGVAWGEPVAVTAWGLVSGRAFYPATAWLET